MLVFSFFFNDTATTDIYTLSLHDALPIYHVHRLADLRIGEELPRPVVEGRAAQKRHRGVTVEEDLPHVVLELVVVEIRLLRLGERGVPVLGGEGGESQNARLRRSEEQTSEIKSHSDIV